MNSSGKFGFTFKNAKYVQGERMCVYLISDSRKQSIEACCEEHAPSK